MSPLAAPDIPASDIAARIARFSRSRDLVDLWPDTTHEALARARAEIDRVVRAAILEDAAPAVEVRARGAVEARALSLTAYSMGVGPLLGSWIRDGRVVADPDVGRRLLEQLSENRAYADRVEQEFLATADALLAAGIVPVVFKGFHTARSHWHDVGVRPFADVDVVVPPERVDDVEVVLQAAGFVATTPHRAPYSRHWSRPRVGRDDRVHSLERVDSRNPWRLDVHDGFDCEFRDAAYARLDVERSRVAPFSVRGRMLLAPAQPLLVLLLGCHLSKDLHSMRLFRIAELITVMRTDLASGALHWDDLMRALDGTGAARFLFPAFALVDRLVPEVVDRHVLRELEHRSNWMIRRVVQRLTPAGGMPRKDMLSTFMWADDPVTLARAVTARFLGYGDRNPVARWLGLLREARLGAIRFGTGDERQDTS